MHISKSTLSYSVTRLLFLLFVSGLLSACNKEPDEKIALWPMKEECDLHYEACTSKMGDSTVSLKISPDPIPVAKPLGIELKLTNLEAEKIELDISGANMYMGYNRVTLTPTGEPGRYVGTSMLAFCTTSKMQWKVTLIIHQKNHTKIHIPYMVVTDHR
ncbi:MAG: hypothetical protein ISEC1_P2029 [Thiomicrorhabdus sp.]|nr:MAG: hypothetical protein ISEC1_P2029 [Thiomicrorhabdus sp.]